MDRFSLVGNHEIGAIEDLYKSYLQNPTAIEESWRNFFKGFEFARKSYDSKSTELVDKSHLQKEFNILNLINGYRQRGHLFTRTRLLISAILTLPRVILPLYSKRVKRLG